VKRWRWRWRWRDQQSFRITLEAAVHYTVVVVRIAGIATAVHSVEVVVVVVHVDHTLVIGINHVLESFLKLTLTNYHSTFVALHRVFNRVY